MKCFIENARSQLSAYWQSDEPTSQSAYHAAMVGSELLHIIDELVSSGFSYSSIELSWLMQELCDSLLQLQEGI